MLEDKEMSMPRQVFQLSTVGESRNGWLFKMKSTAVFANPNDAKNQIPEFEASCVDESHIESAVPDTLETTIMTLDFYDDSHHMHLSGFTDDELYDESHHRESIKAEEQWERMKRNAKHTCPLCDGPDGWHERDCPSDALDTCT